MIEGATSVYPERPSHFEIHGERGTVVFDDNGVIEWTFADDAAQGLKPESGAAAANGHQLFVADMVEAILDHRDPLVSGEEARKAVDIILAIYESQRTGREIVLGSAGA